MAKLTAIIQLSRPINTLITGLSVLVAVIITGKLTPVSALILACLSAGLIAAASNTINDVFDIEIDRVNKPLRPLASGKLSKNSAQVVALIEYFIGNVLALFISTDMFLFAFLFSILSFLYSAYLKRTILWGNFAVSFISAAAFIYGGLAVNRPLVAVIPAGFAFFFHFGREIIKDLEDIKGDTLGNARTLPIRFGPGPCIALIWVNFIILILLTILPYGMGWYGGLYFLIVVVGVYPVILYALITILKNTQPAHLGFLSNLLKADMLVGLLAIYLR
ncbi:MAG: hypothetical protein GWN61_13755 [candidate division Zixibacteria bacterium]|nr:hypothetical protein [candidate division KSB1 bacterium]NIT72391.1 hypothetical protein [candidate division KSB1 bacterium]NIV07206.1 hypothetical protein [candidate division Zixibacteria bacterium]NIX72071.1 hypothetical protein [candidate division KSB1 bacterium]